MKTISINYTELIKFFPTQRELKGLEARHWLKVYSLININNATHKPFKLVLKELAQRTLTALNPFDLA